MKSTPTSIRVNFISYLGCINLLVFGGLMASESDSVFEIYSMPVALLDAEYFGNLESNVQAKFVTDLQNGDGVWFVEEDRQVNVFVPASLFEIVESIGLEVLAGKGVSGYFVQSCGENKGDDTDENSSKGRQLHDVFIKSMGLDQSVVNLKSCGTGVVVVKPVPKVHENTQLKREFESKKYSLPEELLEINSNITVFDPEMLGDLDALKAKIEIYASCGNSGACGPGVVPVVPTVNPGIPIASPKWSAESIFSTGESELLNGLTLENDALMNYNMSIVE